MRYGLESHNKIYNCDILIIFCRKEKSINNFFCKFVYKDWTDITFPSSCQSCEKSFALNLIKSEEWLQTMLHTHSTFI